MRPDRVRSNRLKGAADGEMDRLRIQSIGCAEVAYSGTVLHKAVRVADPDNGSAAAVLAQALHDRTAKSAHAGVVFEGDDELGLGGLGEEEVCIQRLGEAGIDDADIEVILRVKLFGEAGGILYPWPEGPKLNSGAVAGDFGLPDGENGRR